MPGYPSPASIIAYIRINTVRIAPLAEPAFAKHPLV
jgi:hypothetical protein